MKQNQYKPSTKCVKFYEGKTNFLPFNSFMLIYHLNIYYLSFVDSFIEIYIGLDYLNLMLYQWKKFITRSYSHIGKHCWKQKCMWHLFFENIDCCIMGNRPAYVSSLSCPCLYTGQKYSLTEVGGSVESAVQVSGLSPR